MHFNQSLSELQFEPTGIGYLEMVAWEVSGRRTRVGYSPSDALAMLLALPPGELAKAIADTKGANTEKVVDRLSEILHELVDVAISTKRRTAKKSK